MSSFIRGLLLSALLMPTLALAQEASPRLVTLASPLPADFAEKSQVSPVGEYGASWMGQLQMQAGTESGVREAASHALVMVLSGRGHLDFSGEIVPLHERQVLHLNPGERYAIVAETNMDMLVMRLPPEK